MEWRPVEILALRTGYRSDTINQLSAIAGFTVGTGLQLWGQEFSYAWLPYGDLGNTQYFSLLLRFGDHETLKKNLQRRPSLTAIRKPIYQQLMQLPYSNT